MVIVGGKVMRDWYSERVGKVYGVFKVLNVEYDFNRRKQLWTLRCLECGKIVKSFNGKDLRKGRWGQTCTHIRPEKIKRETYEEKVNKHIGEIINGWKIVRYDKCKGLLVECVKCGRVCYKPAKQVLESRATKCLCEMENGIKYDESWLGKKFGHLTITGISRKNGKRAFTCKCDCGNETVVSCVGLAKGSVLCCEKGCKYKNENNKTALGESGSRLYHKWRGVLNRCENLKSNNYNSYGGRGIKVCDEWHDYLNFRKWALENGWNEKLPKGEQSIDRINPDGNYEPSNCRFITLEENTRLARKSGHITLSGKRRNTKYNKILVLVKGKEMSLLEASRELGFDIQFLSYRINKKGMSPQEAIETPKLQTGRPKKG